MNRTTIKALFLLALLAFPIGKVIAGLSITPAFVRMDKTIQGKKYNIPITVTNQSAKQTEHFIVSVDSPHSKAKINGLPAEKVISWTKFKPSKFTLQPGQTQTVMMSVKVPKGYVGDYRLYLAVSQDPKKYNLKFKKRKKRSAVGVMQLGKVSTRIPEFKTHIKALLKINIPIVIRAQKPGKKIRIKTKQVKLDRFKIVPSNNPRKAMTATSIFTNKTKYDVLLDGSCTILNKKGSKKLAEVKLSKKSLVQPKESAPISCDFNSALPRGKYQIQGNFRVSVKSSNASVKINKRQKIKIGKELADKMSNRGSSGLKDTINTPLLLSSTMIQQEIVNGKVRKETIEIVNPTSKKLSVISSFNLTNENRIKVIIKPRKFKLKAGASKRITIDFKSKDKKEPIFGWLEFRTKQTKGAVPVAIPVILVPESKKLKHKIKMGGIKATLSASNTRISFSTTASSSKKGKEALYLISKLTIEDVQAGALLLSKAANLSNENLLPGGKISVQASVDFDQLKDGVYKIMLSIESNESKVRKAQKVNIVVNRDIAQIVKVVTNE
jgi:hypothetical protein